MAWLNGFKYNSRAKLVYTLAPPRRQALGLMSGLPSTQRMDYSSLYLTVYLELGKKLMNICYEREKNRSNFNEYTQRREWMMVHKHRGFSNPSSPAQTLTNSGSTKTTEWTIHYSCISDDPFSSQPEVSPFSPCSFFEPKGSKA
ncbi:uncharacterized protein LOC143651517 isoform X2 [Tamandua tetradactyla]|uniref:uncharacterized protein LOC143651517 isoform X2 n=1 Tax=Tamandua tetradactyla TaxID=48850 RepID=UPI004053A579